jgi:hypothetical protein
MCQKKIKVTYLDRFGVTFQIDYENIYQYINRFQKEVTGDNFAPYLRDKNDIIQAFLSFIMNHILFLELAQPETILENTEAFIDIFRDYNDWYKEGEKEDTFKIISIDEPFKICAKDFHCQEVVG